MSDYKVGDKIRLTFGQANFEDVINEEAAGFHWMEGDKLRSVENYELNGWSVTIVQPAKEEYVMPTEDGYYLDRSSDLWSRVGDGWTLEGSYFSESSASTYAPFTRLIPEDEVPTEESILKEFALRHSELLAELKRQIRYEMELAPAVTHFVYAMQLAGVKRAAKLITPAIHKEES